MSISRWRGRPWLAVAELTLAGALFVGDFYDIVPFSSTPFFLVLGWISLRLRGLRWRDVGLVRPDGWLRSLAIGIAAGVAMELLAVYATEPLIARLVGTYPDLSDFRPLVGNLKLVLILFALIAVLGPIGEELVFRGYLMNLFAGLAGGVRGSWLLSLLLVSALFGWSHASGQGLAGALQEGLSGLLLGVTYLACGRKLTIPIVAHGAANALALVLIYLGRYPGV